MELNKDWGAVNERKFRQLRVVFPSFWLAENRDLCSSDMLWRMENHFRDVGGTPGGLGHFLIGFAMVCIGGFLITHQVMVVGSYWSFFGANTFGVTLIPMLFGVGILFWNGRSLVGWLLTIAGVLFILAGVIANMHIFFRPASLFDTLVMLVLLVGGIGLIARAMKSHPTKSSE